MLRALHMQLPNIKFLAWKKSYLNLLSAIVKWTSVARTAEGSRGRCSLKLALLVREQAFLYTQQAQNPMFNSRDIVI